MDVPGRDPVHVAVGNERLFKNHEKLSFVRSPVVSEVKNSGATPYKGKCVLRKGQEIELKQFVDTCPTSTIVFVSVDDEMALCLSLGGRSIVDCSDLCVQEVCKSDAIASMHR